MWVIMYGASPYMKAALMSLDLGHKTDNRNKPDLNMLILCTAGTKQAGEVFLVLGHFCGLVVVLPGM